MKTGTAEIIDEIEEPLKKRSGFSGGANPGSGGGNKGGGANGPNGEDVSNDSPEVFSPAKSLILTTFLLLVVLMTFGGLIAAYVVIGTNKSQEWQPFALPLPLWISTLMILLSSISYVISERSMVVNDQRKAKKWLVVTTFLGGVFIASQLLSWLELTSRGLYIYGNPYVAFFYVLTAVHAVHVIGGIAALSTILLKSRFPAQNNNELSKRVSLANVVGWYWHFMGVLWIILFLLLGFWR